MAKRRGIASNCGPSLRCVGSDRFRVKDELVPSVEVDHFWLVDAFAAAAGGHWLVAPGHPHARLSGVSIDTRSLQRGEVFFAIAGERVDGHDFVGQALRQGALAVVVSAARISEQKASSAAGGTSGGVLAVDDTVAALQRAGSVYREVLGRAGVTVIAVGGSNGKTTTRSLIHAALSQTMLGTQSPKSYNNHLGVPLTLLATNCYPSSDSSTDASDDGDMTSCHRFVVCEIGTNHPGEVAPLMRMTRPDVSVLTSLGREHLGQFGSFEAVVREEAALMREVGDQTQLVAEAEAWQTLRSHRAIDRDATAITYGLGDRAGAAAGPPPDLSITDGPHPAEAGQRFTVNDSWPVSLPLVGRHNAINALAPLAVGRAMGLDPRPLIAGIERATPVPGRMVLRAIGQADTGVTLLDDSYNANPDSMRAALTVLQEQAGRRHSRAVAVLGDMAELGETSEPEHHALGRWLANADPAVALIVTVGEAARVIGKACAQCGLGDRVYAFDESAVTQPAIRERVARLLRPGDCVLLKASRSVALERIVPAIEARFADRA